MKRYYYHTPDGELHGPVDVDFLIREICYAGLPLGLMVREEYNLPLTAEAYAHLREKADGKLITKRRYLIPFGKYTIELDLFSSPKPDLMLAEVEFSSEEEALAFKAPDWFGEDVTSSSEYHNSTLSQS